MTQTIAIGLISLVVFVGIVVVKPGKSLWE